MKIRLFIFLLIFHSISLAQTTTVQGTVKDKQTPSIFLDSAYVRGIDLNTHELLFEDYTDLNGFYQKEIITAVEDETHVPTQFEMSQNYPNPFNPSTKFSIYVPETKDYNLGIYNILGETIISESYPELRPGNYTFDISGLGPAGIYLYTISSPEHSETKKMVQLDGSHFNPKLTKYDEAPNKSLQKINQNIEMRIYASKNGYYTDSVDVSFPEGTTNTQDFLLTKNTFDFNATIKLYNTKGDTITDLDSIKITWPDGNTEMIPNNNGTVTLNKTLFTLNSDTTATITHNHPEQYLNWVIGTTVNTDRIERLYQNPGPGPNTMAKIPLNLIIDKTSELYLIPRFTTHGVNNNVQIDMDNEIINTFFNRGGGGRTGCFIPSPRGYDTTDVILKLYSEFTGQPVDSSWITIAKREVLTFLTSTQFPNKKLLNYRFTEIASENDPFYMYLKNPNGRNRDNLSVTTYGQSNVNHKEYEGIFGGTVRIYASNSWYNYPVVGVITEEFYCSMICIEIDGPSYVRKSDGTYTDLGKHLIGINHLMKPGTYWRSWK